MKSFGYPLAIAAAQQGVGLLYVVPLWILGVRKFPKVTFDDVLLLFPIGEFHNLTTVFKTLKNFITNWMTHHLPSSAHTYPILHGSLVKCGSSCMRSHRQLPSGRRPFDEW